MSTVVVVCPHCRKELKLRDRSKLGQKGRCPGCSKPFVLQETAEEEVQFELVEAKVPVGTGAQWVPDEPAAAARPAEPPLFTTVDTSPAAAGTETALSGLSSADDGLQRLKEIRRRNAKRRNLAIVFGGVTALAIGGAIWAWTNYSQSSGATDAAVAAATPAAGTPAASVAGSPSAAATGSSPGLPTVIPGPNAGTVIIPYQNVSTPLQRKQNGELVDSLAPPREGPVQLKMIPSGMNVVMHLRPSRLWSEEAVWQELRYSLTEDVTNWIAAALKEHCRREPQQIEECVICFRLGAIGTPPEVASVVHFAREEKLSDLIEEFRGQRFGDDLGGPRIHVSSPHAYLIKDTRTVAIAPEQDAAEFPDVYNTSNTNTTAGVYQLLSLTDRARAFTVVFEVDDVKRHENWLFSDRTRPIFQRVLNWFGDDVETVAWSVDIHDESMISDLVLRPRSVSNASRVATEVLQRLEFLPRDLQAACLKMFPATQGFRDIIGRFPAMLEAFRQATVPTVDTRHVRLTTVLPRKAAPNLALGTLLAWDESTRTNFSAGSPPPAAIAAAALGGAPLPDKVEDRLKLTLDGEFNQPFQDAVAYIASECQVTIDIDGNALKDAGFTKNMPLKLTTGKVTGLEAFRQIVTYEGYRPPVPEKRLCIVIDEASKSVLVTTESFAQAAGQTIYPLVTE